MAGKNKLGWFKNHKILTAIGVVIILAVIGPGIFPCHNPIGVGARILATKIFRELQISPATGGAFFRKRFVTHYEIAPHSRRSAGYSPSRLPC